MQNLFINWYQEMKPFLIQSTVFVAVSVVTFFALFLTITGSKWWLVVTIPYFILFFAYVSKPGKSSPQTQPEPSAQSQSKDMPKYIGNFTYSSESLVDLETDLDWVINNSGLPKDEHGFIQGTFKVSVEWENN